MAQGAGAAQVQVGGLVYEVLVPASDAALLSAHVGQEVEFHTLHYLEGQGQGSSYWPRLVGFRTAADREFFELFTTVKGIGTRKALRALQAPFGRVAQAVAARDLGFLTALPEIGRKTAETIVVELRGKVERFAMRGPGATTGGANGGGAASGPAAGAAGAAGAASAAGDSAVAPGARRGRGKAAAAAGSQASMEYPMVETTPAQDAVAILVQLGETRLAAESLVDLVLQREPGAEGADRIVAAALRSRVRV